MNLSLFKELCTLEHAIVGIGVVLTLHIIMDYLRFRAFKKSSRESKDSLTEAHSSAPPPGQRLREP